MAVNHPDSTHIQNIDVQVLCEGPSVPVYLDSSFNDGWRGGQAVIYTGNSVGEKSIVKNIRVVGMSDGNKVVGFIVRGSDFHPQIQQPGSYDNRISEYNWSSMKPTVTKVVKMIFDGSYIFKVYEKYGFGDRESTGTALVYALNDFLYVSDRGLLTTEADATASVADPKQVGLVWMVPSADNGYCLGVDLRVQ